MVGTSGVRAQSAEHLSADLRGGRRAVAHEHVDEALFVEQLAARIRRLGDAVGVEADRVAGRERDGGGPVSDLRLEPEEDLADGEAPHRAAARDDDRMIVSGAHVTQREAPAVDLREEHRHEPADLRALAYEAVEVSHRPFEFEFS